MTVGISTESCVNWVENGVIQGSLCSQKCIFIMVSVFLSQIGGIMPFNLITPACPVVMASQL